MPTDLQPQQAIFSGFYAILWGAIASSLGRWRAFQFPLMNRPKVQRRVLASTFFFNIAPILYFLYVLKFTYHEVPSRPDSFNTSLVRYVLEGILPAFGILGIHRAWIALIEWRPSLFYSDQPDATGYRHVEPYYRTDPNKLKANDDLVIDLGAGAWRGNSIAASVFLIAGSTSPWLSRLI